MPSLELAETMPLSKKWSNDYIESSGAALPPDVSTISGRPAEPWEQEAKKRAILAGREAAAALVRRP